MDFLNGKNTVRTGVNIKRRVLKDGTVKEYTYTRTYPVKTDRKVNGKTEIMSRLSKCTDPAVIGAVADLLAESGY